MQAYNEKSEEETMQTVVFRLEEDFLSCPVSQVQEIIKVDNITSLPKSRSEVRGVIDRRGNVITIIDLAKALNKDVELSVKKSQLIILHVEDENLGVLVSEVTEIPTISKEEIEELSEGEGVGNKEDYMEGIIKRKEDLIVLIDLISLAKGKNTEDNSNQN